MKLRVDFAAAEDVYRDIVRVPERYRLDTHQRLIREGSVCRVRAPNGVCYAIVRGLNAASSPAIQIDERLRNALGVKVGQDVDVQLDQVGIWGQFFWAWGASDPAYRVAARLGLLSVVLGFLGFVLGLLSLKGSS